MLKQLQQSFSQQSDMVLVLSLVGILLILFTPIPPGLLDFLLIINISFALLILLLTFYVTKPLQFSTFPSLLLIATLFRLSLNIAATRLILSEAHAGEVIDAIGNHVVGGNYIIGFIVFLVLIVVQYVVVTNGAQRVAEVAARFTLDSMPGKQMSIDADMNIGLIDENEARERRLNIEKEGSFYGSMDGASKFVKGDAIAGIIIIIIDVVAGLSIGIVQHGMDWSEALHIYTLLTVGDGIVTQIPALIIATATGIIVTRSASDQQLSKEISKQILLFPKILVLVSGALFITLFIPGIPAFPVTILFIVMSLLAVFAFKQKDNNDFEQELSEKQPDNPEANEDLYSMLPVEPIEVQVGVNLIPLMGDDSRLVMDRISAFRKQIALELGFVFPNVRVKDNKKLAPNSYKIHVYDAPIAQGEIISERTLAIDPGTIKAKVEGVETKDPTYGLPAVWIVSDQKKEAKEAGYTLVEAETVFITHLNEIIRQQSSNLLTRKELEKLLEPIKQNQPTLIDELIPAVLRPGDIQKILQNLLREKVSIRNLENILEVLLDYGNEIKDPEHLTEFVRQRLGNVICQSLTNALGDLYVLTLDPSVEKNMIAGIRNINDKTVMVLEPSFSEQVMSKVANQVEKMMTNNMLPVIICAPELRRHLRNFTERAMPHLSIISMGEVPNTVNLKSFGMVPAV
ncbi:MAG: flagellar biosynthesis protein FlhA [Gammaproteobacteria bacterium]|nr:flagellar biosynthesis protein FlhA [Gammaproteobacteria bacterium]